jgi:hypothetical protein
MWINAAYAQCPVNQGCEIDAANGTNAPYLTGTTVDFGVNSKNVVLDCKSQNGTENSGVIYVGSGVAILMDNGAEEDPTNAGSYYQELLLGNRPVQAVLLALQLGGISW